MSWETAYPSFRQRPWTIPDLLRWRAEANADDVALVAPDATLTFAEWARRASALARLLRERGTEPKTPVGIWGDNSRAADWATALVGVQWAGAIPVPINSRMRLPAALAALERLDAEVLVLQSNDPVSGVEAVRFDELPPGGELDDPLSAPEDPGAILHTSGTTGLPKPAVLSQVGLAFVGAATEDHILGEYSGIEPLREGDVLQTSVGLHTSSGLLHILLAGIYSRLKLVVEASFGVESTLDTMRREGTKLWFCVPSMMVLVGDACAEPVQGVRLAAAWHAGSPVSEVALEGMRRAFPGSTALNLYSLTESGAAIYSSTAEDALLRAGTVGLPIPTTEAKVLREDGTPVAPGESGRIFLRSVHMLEGYWRNGRVEPGGVDESGWMDTGDGGYVDAEGHTWVTGRMGDVIVRGGYNVMPNVVEAAILEHAAIADVAVVPVPHRVLGQELVAMVVVHEDVDADALREHCLGRLADYEIPRTLIPVEELARNEFGKLDRRAIRADAEARVQALRT
jgi:acyl-CoA synthetase (AMP-forming)/AMP-acid ligase II